MKRIFFAFILALTLLSIFAQSIFAAGPWFVGNDRTNAYGVKANITVPTTTPTLYSGLIAAWVATANYNNNWVETGWAIVYGYAPWSFVEIQQQGGQRHDVYWRSQLSYGNDSIYQVSYSSTYWNCYINGVLEAYFSGGGLPNPPTRVRAWAEVQGSSSNQLSTIVYNVYWKNSSGTWYLFNQSQWHQDNPYKLVKYQYYYYYCYGP